jgi:ArsR family transcriptional regulator
MQADRARLTKACCTPEKFVMLQEAPRQIPVAPSTISASR